MSGPLVVDASVAAKWLVLEAGSDHAARLLDGSRMLAAPDFMLLEVDNLVCKLIRRGAVSAVEAAEMRGVLRTVPVSYYPFGLVLEAGYALATRTRRSLYDCLYLALAVALDGQLVTADRPFYEEVRRRLPDLSVCWVETV